MRLFRFLPVGTGWREATKKGICPFLSHFCPPPSLDLYVFFPPTWELEEGPCGQNKGVRNLLLDWDCKKTALHFLAWQTHVFLNLSQPPLLCLSIFNLFSRNATSSPWLHVTTPPLLPLAVRPTASHSAVSSLRQEALLERVSFKRTPDESTQNVYQGLWVILKSPFHWPGVGKRHSLSLGR